jgi:flagellar motor switch protein FliN/FliY
VTFTSALSETASATGRGEAEAACADALVQHLPGPALLLQRHAGAPVPADLPGAVSATYVGSRSAEFALLLLETGELAAAGGDAGRLRLADVLRPALEQAAAVIGGGMLGEITEGSAAAVLAAPGAVVFDLVGETGIAGWFAVLLRDRPAAPHAGDVSSRLGRISNVELTIAVEIGRARISVRDLLAAQPGTVIELDRSVGSLADVFLNGRLIAHGEVVVVDQQFAVRVTRVLDPVDEG